MGASSCYLLTTPEQRAPIGRSYNQMLFQNG